MERINLMRQRYRIVILSRKKEDHYYLDKYAAGIDPELDPLFPIDISPNDDPALEEAEKAYKRDM